MKDRLDILLVNKGLFPSREKAKASIMAGIVYVDGQRVDKAGTLIDENAELFVKENLCPYVSRGGLKLEKAIETFNFSLDQSIAADMGASTGGFTDCMLQKGAKKVYAIDVGYGQLDYKLRTDNRVINMEKTNIRYMDTDLILEPVDFISIDVSFISLNLIFPVAAKVLAQTGSIVALVKPQFEAGREQIGKKGIVRDPAVHKEVIQKVMGYAKQAGLAAAGLTYSPVTGAKGNIEYLLYLTKNSATIDSQSQIEQVVSCAHQKLNE
ncbi:MAG: TlyA family RNA methyltransferase [Anaerovoracaceae bacterium]